MTPDVHLLLAALRPDHPHHQPASAWLESAVVAAATCARLTLMSMVIASYLGLVTSERIFAKPTNAKDAVGAMDKILAEPGVAMATLGTEWAQLRGLCVDKNLSGNDLPDAWPAAATLHVREHPVTFDSDFKKLLPRNHLTVLVLPHN